MIKSIVVAVAFAVVAHAHADESVPQQTDYAEVAAAINETTQTHHYDPAELDTPGYKQIDAAYVAITNRGADALLIDLRENGGGAFAVRPLVAHLLNETVDGGSFVSQRWNATHNRAPNLSELKAVAPWEGWSIRAAGSQGTRLTTPLISFAKVVFARE